MGGLVRTNDEENNNKKYIDVEVINLDEFIINSSYSFIDVLKVDVEGAETFVLRGSRNLLKEKKIKHIFFEENEQRINALGLKVGETQRLLKSLGYKSEKLSDIEWYSYVDCDFKK